MNGHRAHDYRFLIARWRAVSRASGLPLKRFATAGKYPLYFLQSPALTGQTPGIYMSAGIHGDEPGATEGLIAWAEKNVAQLARWPLLIFPALNPWGLVNNRRDDADGLDLNRTFHRDEHPMIRALKARVAPFHFTVAIFLHEDFDGQGFYLYEVEGKATSWGEALLAKASRAIPIDPRPRIDTRKAVHGLIRRRFDLQRFTKMGFPEAIWLHQAHTARALTMETPSEFALAQRIRAHGVVLDECVRRALREQAGVAFKK